ncbi:hypothetical protein M404DRAFT_678729 [Pisolithus tinctorius Marx 270]|uniref:Uncharacterized protein n=1 Tax=Pisolithus tinctorius Marx 270 TaxID=870435 RepID=A0A0C3JTM2_PISTI|nr:hypothetical protein M404DRAFT_678729 [Pisolithus tinctorius Marx 270]
MFLRTGNTGPASPPPSALDKYYRGTSVLNIMRTCKARTKRELNFRVVVACHVARPVGLKVEGGLLTHSHVGTCQ